MDVPFPANEDERLAALNQIGILDTDPEASFDRITTLAQDLFDVSSAAVTLIDRDRQWFKSICGWEIEETDRESSFCTYAILDDGVMVVEDATEDERFADNPFVTGEKIRFYAGAPLDMGDNLRLGTLCLTDERPRSFGRAQQARLTTLADIVVDLLEVHRMTYQIGYLKSALEEAEDAVVITEAEPLEAPGPRIVWTNKAFSRMTGYERGELVGQTPRMLQGPETDRSVLNKVRSALENERAVHAETVNYRKDGTPYVVSWHIAPVYSETNELTHWVSTQRDVTDQQKREERLKHKAMHDALTNLPNRYAVQQDIRELMQARSDESGALLYLDLDDFKPINDEYGHNTGDQVLVRTAELLRTITRGEDRVGRIGGDEFVICLPDATTAEEARSVADRIHKTLRFPIETDRCDLRVSASIGGVVGLSSYDTIDQALHAADMAMYEAKEGAQSTVIADALPSGRASEDTHDSPMSAPAEMVSG